MKAIAAIPSIPNPVDFNCYARSLMVGRGSLGMAAGFAEATPGISPRTVAVLKSAVAAGTTTDTAWAASLVDYEVVQSGFLESLRSVGVFDRMLANGIRRVPLKSRLIASTMATVGAATLENQPKPIFAMAFVGENLEPLKAVATVAISAELAKHAASAAFIGEELRRGVVAATDGLFLSGLALGVTPIPATGSDAAAVGAGVRALLDAIDTSADSALYLILPPLVAKRLAGMSATDGSFAFPEMGPQGGTLAGISVLVSDQMADDEATLIDAAQIAGNSDVILLDGSGQASVEMNDAPAGGAGAVVTSLWQQNLLGLRAERWFGFAAARAGAVALLDGVAWGGAPA